MRSPESSDNSLDRSPDAIKFESDLIKHLNEAREENVTYGGLKQKIRKFCVDNAKIDKERDLMISGGYMYFFRYIIDQPEIIVNIWKLLYEFQEELNEKDEEESDDIEIKTKMSGLFNEEVIGLTLNWQLVRSILEGQLKVEKATFKGKDIYYMTGPDEEESRVKAISTKREKILKRFEEKLKEIEEKSKHNQKLLTKPAPGISSHPAIDEKTEMPVLIEIYQSLKNDADMIYYSLTWRNQINHFFDVVLREKIEEIIKKLTTGEWRSERFIPFFQEILDTYLAPLKQYCADLSAQNTGYDKISANQIPADMMLEPILIKNSYLDEQYKTVPIELILAKWDVLWEEINHLVANKNTGTRFMMEAVQAPSPKPEDEEKLAVLVQDRVRGAIDEKTDEWDEIWDKKRPIDIHSTAAMQAFIAKEAERYPGSLPINDIKKPAEEKPLNGNIDLRFKASRFLDTTTSLYSPKVIEGLRSKIEHKILPELKSKELKREFMLILLEKLSRCLDANPEVDFKPFQNMIRDILNKLVVSENVDEDAYIPNESFVKNAKNEIPNLDNEEYADFKNLLTANGDYQYFLNIQRRLEGLINELISRLQIHRDLEKKLKGQPYPQNAAKQYEKVVKKLIFQIKQEKKRFKGLLSLKSFGRWLTGKGKINKQAHIYFTQLDDAIDQLWEEGCIPTFGNFTTLYFGTQNE